MNKKSLFLSAVIFLSFSISSLVSAGTIYQNFEPDNGIPINIWSRTLEGSASVVDRHDGVHLGQNAARYESGWNWNGLGINTTPELIDFKQVNNDRFTFWTLAFPHVTCEVWGCDTAVDNNIGISFHDASKYASGGFDVWTVKKAKYKQWTKLEVLFSQLPPDFDLKHISQIQFINYWPGKYYLDDFHAVREDRVYQSFNQDNRSGTTDGDYGWKWNDGDSAGLSASGEPVYEGSHSWKMVLNGKWGGGGIASEQQNYFFNKETKSAEQSFWHNNFLPENNDRLSLWVYALPENGMDNNINIQIYDHGAHSTDETKAQVWTKLAARYGHWTQLEVLFKNLPKDLNLRDIDKIQIQNYWAGTFYIDDIRATGPRLKINEAALKILAKAVWNYLPGVNLKANYRLQESVQGPDGPWVTVYSGPKYDFQLNALTTRWLRVRWEENFADKKSIPYYSPWSDVVEYNPASVNFRFNSLAKGRLAFNTIPQANLYEIQTASAVTGPWKAFYKGPGSSGGFLAQQNQWYRVRAIKENNGALIDSTAWSRPQVYSPTGTGFVKAAGTVLKDRDGQGNQLVLTGFNLGNYLLTEDWMTGFGLGDNPAIPDDWTMRDILISRFGTNQTEKLLRTFENAYLNDFDFDLLARANVTLVRLPIFYRNLMDDNGNFILDAKGQIDFTQLDRIVDGMADRGIYTLLDLHGAPGSQSAESHTGRKDFNKLFENTSVGETYRTRTENLWREIAKHYKNNTWVLGYDLVNEPTGAATPTALADLYDRLYRVIRAVDTNHLIVMEGNWDWDSLPNPGDRHWQNVMYQFHYYCPMIAEPQKKDDPLPVMGTSCADYGSMDSRLAYQKAFIDTKVANSRQALYQVPAMVGEFSAHDDKQSWEYYLQTFKTQKWSWTVWSYKDHSSPSNWAIVNHANYNDILPKFRAVQANGTPGDTYDDLLRKVSKYATADFHVINATLKELLKNNMIVPAYYQTNLTLAAATVADPIVVANKDLNLKPDGTFNILGSGMCDTPGTVEFFPASCIDEPPGSAACNNGDAAISFWSENSIKGYVPPDYTPISLGGAKINCIYGGPLYPTMIPENRAPVFNAISNRLISEGQTLTFTIAASDPDGDSLKYSAQNLPAGASFSGQTFSWTPNYTQAGKYDVTFRVSDGILGDEKTVTITVVDIALGQGTKIKNQW